MMAATIYGTVINSDPFIDRNKPEETLINVPKEKKKRSRNPDNWIKEKRKRAILSGQSYLNTKGELVSPKAIGPDCRCKHKCYVSVTPETRSAIFNGYYSLKSYDEQNSYLYGLIRRYDIQRKRKPVSERRTCSYKYYVRVKGRETQICKKAFANIHGISDKKIRTLCIKHEQNILFPRDNRGRHNNRPKKVTPEMVNLIKHHILKVLSGPNGTDCVKTDKNQSPEVNISKLHKSFLQEFEPDAIDSESDKLVKDYDANVKSWLYFKVFHDEFNSLDFNTVKRKLSDLRKSLEASGTISAVKKKPKTQPSSSKGNKKQTPESLVPNQSLALHSGPIAPLQAGYMGCQNSHFPLSVLGLPTSHHNQSQFPHQSVQVPHGSHQQQQQQPLNLQTGVGGGLNLPESTTPLSVNLHSMGGPMSSYYLCFSHVSNLIPLPVSSSSGGGGSVQPHVVGTPLGGPSSGSNFIPQPPTMQYSGPPLISYQSSEMNPNILQGYNLSSQQNSMY